mmetsp:Transcript_27624/g.92792  ORF Transcript_27624/g.92792 Transcript_27624/m.92792 type:complete len:331 (+) Transcript_27624:57-1049(+)
MLKRGLPAGLVWCLSRRPFGGRRRFRTLEVEAGVEGRVRERAVVAGEDEARRRVGLLRVDRERLGGREQRRCGEALVGERRGVGGVGEGPGRAGLHGAERRRRPGVPCEGPVGAGVAARRCAKDLVLRRVVAQGLAVGAELRGGARGEPIMRRARPVCRPAVSVVCHLVINAPHGQRHRMRRQKLVRQPRRPRRHRPRLGSLGTLAERAVGNDAVAFLRFRGVPVRRGAKVLVVAQAQELLVRPVAEAAAVERGVRVRVSHSDLDDAVAHARVRAFAGHVAPGDVGEVALDGSSVPALAVKLEVRCRRVGARGGGRRRGPHSVGFGFFVR